MFLQQQQVLLPLCCCLSVLCLCRPEFDSCTFRLKLLPCRSSASSEHLGPMTFSLLPQVTCDPPSPPHPTLSHSRSD